MRSQWPSMCLRPHLRPRITLTSTQRRLITLRSTRGYGSHLRFAISQRAYQYDSRSRDSSDAVLNPALSHTSTSEQTNYVIRRVASESLRFSVRRVASKPSRFSVLRVASKPTRFSVRRVASKPLGVNIRRVAYKPLSIKIRRVAYKPLRFSVRRVASGPFSVSIPVVVNKPMSLYTRTPSSQFPVEVGDFGVGDEVLDVDHQNHALHAHIDHVPVHTDNQQYSPQGSVVGLQQYETDLAARPEEEKVEDIVPNDGQSATSEHASNRHRTSHESQQKDKDSEAYKVDSTVSRAFKLTLRRDVMLAMVQTLRSIRMHGLPDTIIKSVQLPNGTSRETSSPSSRNKPGLSQALRRAFRKRAATPEYQAMYKERQKLPINRPDVKKRILSSIWENDVIVLVSETGSGKSTQLPQLILEAMISNRMGAVCSIVCTQPRRLAAISIAQRVAQEQHTMVGDRVGFQVRFDDQNPKDRGSIRYWTAGILFNALRIRGDEVLDDHSLIIIDEVHERDIISDLCLTTLRDLMWARLHAGRRRPKVMLMSATIEAIDFQEYFAQTHNGKQLKVDAIEVPGRNFQVEVHKLDEIVPLLALYTDDERTMQLLQADKKYLTREDDFADYWNGVRFKHMKRDAAGQPTENISEPSLSTARSLNLNIPIELMVATIAHIIRTSDFGDVLVFLPGMGEIDHAQVALQAVPVMGIDFTDTDRFRIFKLHASLYETNDLVFDPVPAGCRRIILSTNIAQTSITLPDVTHIVDSGAQRQMLYNPESRHNEFTCVWTSKAAAKQRQGRAGRTAPGHYWTMATEARYRSLTEKQMPEVRLIELVGHILLTKSVIGDESVRNFVARMLDAPSPASVDSAIRDLRKMHMLTADEQITPLGKFAASLPLHPAQALGLLYGTLFQCLQPLLVVASHNKDKPLIYSPTGGRGQVHANVAFAGLTDDDRFAFIQAFNEYDSAWSVGAVEELSSLEERSVKPDAYREMLRVGRQLYDQLTSYGLVPSLEPDNSVFQQIPEHLNRNSDTHNLVKGLAMSSMHAKLAVWDEALDTLRTRDHKCYLKPNSVNSSWAHKLSGRNSTDKIDGQLLAYTELVHVADSRRLMLSETSSVTPLMAMLFGAPLELVEENVLCVDGWLRYEVTTEDGHTLGEDALTGRAAALVFELRKAIDRFMDIFCSELTSNHRAPAQRSRDRGKNSSNIVQHDLVREALVQGLALILSLDTDAWNEAIDLQAQQKRYTKLHAVSTH